MSERKRAYNAQYYVEHREAAIAYAKSQYYASPKAHNAKSRARYHANKERYEPARQAWAAENREKMLAYYRQKQADFVGFLRSFKEGKPCGRCAGLYPHYVMEFDHVRGVKKYAVSSMTNYRRELVLEEIAKCDLLCCVCHRVKTQEGRSLPRTKKLIEFSDWLDMLKSKPCLDCFHTYPSVAMDFDHVRNDKVSGVAQMWSWSRAKVLAEVAKCELVCANCHRVRTHTRASEARTREAA